MWTFKKCIFSFAYLILLSNLRIADAEESQKLEAPVERFDKTCTSYEMEISAEMTEQITNVPADDNQREVKVKGQNL